MAADPINICLEQLTDYTEFEKFCCALLAGQPAYLNLDPMGGTGDGGRDAIVRDDGAGKKIAFAFTVRKDWFDKLSSDSARLHDTQKKLHILVFVCTSKLSAKDKDKAIDFISDNYGWRLDIFDQARLRMLLVQSDCTLIERHPSIFTPSLFPKPTSTQRKFAQEYLDQYAGLFQVVADSNENLAIEIDRVIYAGIAEVVANAEAVELTCYDRPTLEALTSLHAALTKIHGVISDEWYIWPNPDSWRMKFDNRPHPIIDVQTVLAEKKKELQLYLAEFREALENFTGISKDGPSLTASL